ncbi:MAG: fatty acid desaturase, partial [Rhizobium leguminosarum]
MLDRTSQAIIPSRSTEWPTVILALVIHGGFLALTWWWQSLPLIMAVIAGGWLIAWHGSLQHEVIHGHPTGNQRINDAIGSIPLSLWLPYPIYRESHLEHHRDEYLTDPIEDPESSYFTKAT